MNHTDIALQSRYLGARSSERDIWFHTMSPALLVRLGIAGNAHPEVVVAVARRAVIFAMAVMLPVLLRRDPSITRYGKLVLSYPDPDNLWMLHASLRAIPAVGPARRALDEVATAGLRLAGIMEQAQRPGMVVGTVLEAAASAVECITALRRHTPPYLEGQWFRWERELSKMVHNTMGNDPTR